jgi:cation-transporting ATPase E
MLDIIRLFLVRTLSVSLVILAATIAGSAFPTTPRQSGVLAFLTVGVPTVALAAWAKPAHTPRRLVLSSAYFVVPAAVTIALLTFGVYEFYLSREDVQTARSALTTAGVLCGLALIPVVQPAVPWLAGGAESDGDWRPTLLTGALLGTYVVILAVPGLRNAFELEVLTAPGYAAIAALSAAWAAGMQVFWRAVLPGKVDSKTRTAA